METHFRGLARSRNGGVNDKMDIKGTLKDRLIDEVDLVDAGWLPDNPDNKSVYAKVIDAEEYLCERVAHGKYVFVGARKPNPSEE